MISMLTIEQIIELLGATPEQAVFDWKSDFVRPTTADTQGELIKDIAAIANALTSVPGYIFYGVDPRQPDPIRGISSTYDDARLQQLIAGKVRPAVEFVYYEVVAGTKTVSVVHVVPTRRRPHIISVNVGKIREGQIPIRRGSSTGGATIEDLFQMFYGPFSGYFESVLQKRQLHIQQQQIDLENLKMLDKIADDTRREMRRSLGLPD
jgi:predicted HTH transcriptional regulator